MILKYQRLTAKWYGLLSAIRREQERSCQKEKQIDEYYSPHPHALRDVPITNPQPMQTSPYSDSINVLIELTSLGPR